MDHESFSATLYHTNWIILSKSSQIFSVSRPTLLTHWGRVTHLYVSKLTSIASDNGLSPGRRQTMIWNNAGILLIGPLGTNFSEILIAIQTFSLEKIRLNISSAKKCRPFCFGLNVLKLLYTPRATELINMLNANNMYERSFKYHLQVKMWTVSSLEVPSGAQNA